MLDALHDLRFLPFAVDDDCLVLGRDHAAGMAEHLHGDVFELQPHVVGHDSPAGHDREVAQEVLLALAIARGLHCESGESAAEFVHHEGRECLPFDIFRDHDEFFVPGRCEFL